MIEILPIPALRDNYIWLMKDTDNRGAVIVDPGEAEPVIGYLKEHGLPLVAIFITHHHWDHTGGVEEILQHWQVPVYGPSQEAQNCVTLPQSEGDECLIDELGISFSVLDIPGHTLGHIAYYSSGILFSGDTLFTAGCGRLFEGSAEQMLSSLKKLAALPPETNIYCGHEYTLSNLIFAQAVEPDNQQIATRIAEVKALRSDEQITVPATLAVELQTNPFLRVSEPSVKKAAEIHAEKNLGDEVEIFATLRHWKDQFRAN